MALHAPGVPLAPVELPRPEAGAGELLLRVRACGVCRTDLHIRDGELAAPAYPVVPGHQIVGETEDGRRVGVPWLGWTDGTCRFCRSGRENLCENARFTGLHRPGGYAEWAVADERFCFALPDGYPDLQAAPLLCAGLIGYRALRHGRRRRAPRALRLRRRGPHHLPGRRPRGPARVRVHARRRRAHAGLRARAGRRVGGRLLEAPPEPLDAALVFAPVGALVPVALRATDAGGTVVLAGIHMSEIPAMPYELLWRERTLRSVANLTRRDGTEFLALAPQIPVRTEVTQYAARGGGAGAGGPTPRPLPRSGGDRAVARRLLPFAFCLSPSSSATSSRLTTLPGGVARQLVEELDLARDLVAREVGLHVVLDLARRTARLPPWSPRRPSGAGRTPRRRPRSPRPRRSRRGRPSRSSTSRGKTFSPPETIISSSRPSTNRRPPASKCPTSPVLMRPSITSLLPPPV